MLKRIKDMGKYSKGLYVTGGVPQGLLLSLKLDFKKKEVIDYNTFVKIIGDDFKEVEELQGWYSHQEYNTKAEEALNDFVLSLLKKANS